MRVVTFTKDTEVAEVPSNSTVVEAVKSIPVRMTLSPPNGLPFAGEAEAKVGAKLYVNPPTRVAVPFSLLAATSTAPDAWGGVTADSVVAVRKVTAAAGVPPNVTEVVALKSVPTTVTLSPPKGVPLLGSTAVTLGGLL